MRDPLALLDDEQIDEPGEWIAEQREVLLPVARRVGKRPHAVEGQRQRGPITSASRKPQIAEDFPATDA